VAHASMADSFRHTRASPLTTPGEAGFAIKGSERSKLEGQVTEWRNPVS
jgi:hypothetical protein